MDKKCQNWRKVANLDLSDLEKKTFRAFQSNPALGSWLVPSLGRFMKKMRKSFWENCLKCKKGTNFDLLTVKNYPQSDSTKSFLWYVVNFIQICFMPKKEKKVTKAFQDIIKYVVKKYTVPFTFTHCNLG